MSVLMGRRILLVEDEILIALDTQDELTQAGCMVLGPATRLDSAVALAESERLDAAVLDVNLDGTYVWPLTELLAARRVPYILLTGFGAALELPEHCRTAPRLDKPIRPRALLGVLEDLLRPARTDT